MGSTEFSYVHSRIESIWSPINDPCSMRADCSFAGLAISSKRASYRSWIFVRDCSITQTRAVSASSASRLLFGLGVVAVFLPRDDEVSGKNRGGIGSPIWPPVLRGLRPLRKRRHPI